MVRVSLFICVSVCESGNGACVLVYLCVCVGGARV